MWFLLLVLNFDIWGEDVEDSLLVFEVGDFDGLLYFINCGYVLMLWFSNLIVLLLFWMFNEDGILYNGDL